MRPLILPFLLASCLVLAESASFESGLALYRGGHPREALDRFNDSEKAGEAEPLRGFYQGVCLAKIGDLPAAASRLLAYVSAQSSDPHGWFWLGRAQFLQKRFAEARASIRHSIDLDPKSFESHRTLGEIEIELRNNDAAYRAWIEANRLNPRDSQTTYYLGRLFFEADFLDQAASWLRETLHLAPTHFNAMTYLALCAEHMGDGVSNSGSAVRLYREAILQSKLQKAPYAWAYVSYAKLLRQLGNDGQALAVLEESEKLCPEAHGLAILGQLLAAQNRTARAEAVLRRAIQMDPDISEAHYRLSVLLRSAGRSEEARDEMKRFETAKKLEEQTRNNISAIRK